ncbi:MAG: hypothetical protein GXX78_05455 [Bacteroidales bacterium]|nr:hypothetical protein [Bacteroidales bacterium]
MSDEEKRSSFSVDLKKNNKPFVFLICLLIATVLWFVKALDKNYEITISVPVRYTNVPKNKILVNPPPSKLDLKIRAHGFILVRNKFSLSTTPINLDIKQAINSSNNSQSTNEFVIITDKFIPQISEQLSPDIIVTDVSPDSFVSFYDVVSEKKVKVVSNIQVTCQNQYFLSDSIGITPEYITVRGPAVILDTLKAIPTSNIKFNGLNKPMQTEVPLEKIDQLEYTVTNVSIEIPVSQFTEYTGVVPITLKNVPQNITLITFPAKVTVSCLLAYDKFSLVGSNDFIVEADYNNINPSTSKLSISIKKQPAFVRSVKIQPSEIEYIIKKK